MVSLNRELVDCKGVHKTRVWRGNSDRGTVNLVDNKIDFTIGAKSIVAYAVEDVEVKTRL